MTMRETEQPVETGIRASREAAPYERRWDVEETKASFKTTELWAAIVGVIGLIIVYNASSDSSLDLFRACLLCTVFGAAYIVSRGFAKSGSRPESSDRDNHTRR
jgi:hypothetical protein